MPRCKREKRRSIDCQDIGAQSGRQDKRGWGALVYTGLSRRHVCASCQPGSPRSFSRQRKPRDEPWSCGSQPADKSRINRRSFVLSPALGIDQLLVPRERIEHARLDIDKADIRALMLTPQIGTLSKSRAQVSWPIGGFFQSTDRPRHITPSSPSQLRNFSPALPQSSLAKPITDVLHATEVDSCRQNS